MKYFCDMTGFAVVFDEIIAKDDLIARQRLLLRHAMLYFRRDINFVAHATTRTELSRNVLLNKGQNPK